MAMMVSPEVAKLFQVLTGEEWPDANEDELRALAAEWADAAQALGRLGPGLRSAVQNIRSSMVGDAERAFVERVAPFVEGDSLIGNAQELFQGLADYLLELALDVEYMKLVIINSLIALLVEIALAIKLSPFTGGASMAWLAARMAIVRFLINTLLGKILLQIAQAAIFSIAFQLLIDVTAQVTQFAMGTRDEWNTKHTANAAGVGAMGAALALPMGALGKGVGGIFNKLLDKAFANKFGKGWAKGAIDNIAEIGTEAFHEVLTEALYKYATTGEFEMNPYAASSGAISGAGQVGGGALGDKLSNMDTTGGGGSGSGGGRGGGQNNPTGNQPPPTGDLTGNGDSSGTRGGNGFGNNGSGNGTGNGAGNGFGNNGSGTGNGAGNGFGNNGSGNGAGNGAGNGNGFGNNGSGNGSGAGNGSGSGSGNGNGAGNGAGNGFGNGSGNGAANGFGNGTGGNGPTGNDTGGNGQANNGFGDSTGGNGPGGNSAANNSGNSANDGPINRGFGDNASGNTPNNNGFGNNGSTNNSANNGFGTNGPANNNPTNDGFGTNGPANNNSANNGFGNNGQGNSSSNSGPANSGPANSGPANSGPANNGSVGDGSFNSGPGGNNGSVGDGSFNNGPVGNNGPVDNSSFNNGPVGNNGSVDSSFGNGPVSNNGPVNNGPVGNGFGDNGFVNNGPANGFGNNVGPTDSIGGTSDFLPPTNSSNQPTNPPTNSSNPTMPSAVPPEITPAPQETPANGQGNPVQSDGTVASQQGPLQNQPSSTEQTPPARDNESREQQMQPAPQPNPETRTEQPTRSTQQAPPMISAPVEQPTTNSQQNPAQNTQQNQPPPTQPKSTPTPAPATQPSSSNLTSPTVTPPGVRSPGQSKSSRPWSLFRRRHDTPTTKPKTTANSTAPDMAGTSNQNQPPQEAVVGDVIELQDRPNHRTPPTNSGQNQQNNNGQNQPPNQNRIQPATQNRIQPATQNRIQPATQNRIQPATQNRIQPAPQDRIQPAPQDRTQPATQDQSQTQPPTQNRTQPPSQDQSRTQNSTQSRNSSQNQSQTQNSTQDPAQSQPQDQNQTQTQTPFDGQVAAAEQAVHEAGAARDKAAATLGPVDLAGKQARGHQHTARSSVRTALGAKVATETARGTNGQRTNQAREKVNTAARQVRDLNTAQNFDTNVTLSEDPTTSGQTKNQIDAYHQQLQTAEANLKQAKDELDHARATEVSANAAGRAYSDAVSALNDVNAAVTTTNNAHQQVTDNIAEATKAAADAATALNEFRNAVNTANNLRTTADNLTTQANQAAKDAPSFDNVDTQIRNIKNQLETMATDNPGRPGLETRLQNLNNQRTTIEQAHNDAATLAKNAADARDAADKAAEAVQTKLDQINQHRDTAVNAENNATNVHDQAKDAVDKAEKANDKAKEAAQQGEVERGLTQLSYLPPDSRIEISTLGPRDAVIDAIITLTGQPRADVTNQVNNLTNDQLADAINKGKLTLGTNTIDVGTDLHRPGDTRTPTQHQQPAAVKSETSNENGTPSTEATSSSVPIRIPLFFASPTDLAGAAVRPLVYVGVAAKRAQKFESTTTTSTSTSSERTSFVPATMSLTFSMPGKGSQNATISAGLRTPDITRTESATTNVPPAAYGGLKPGPAVLPPSFRDVLGNHAQPGNGFTDKLLTQNQTPATVDVNGNKFVVTPLDTPSVTLLGTMPVDQSSTTSVGNSWQTTSGSDATLGGGVYVGPRSWFLGGFADVSTGLTDGSTPGLDDSITKSTTDTELVYRIDRPMTVHSDGNHANSVRDTVFGLVKMSPEEARELGLPLPKHLEGSTEVPATQGDSRSARQRYIFGRDDIKSVRTNDIKNFVTGKLDDPSGVRLNDNGRNAVAGKFSSDEVTKNTIYDGMHGGTQVTWEQDGATHFADIYVFPVPPSETTPSGQTSTSTEVKHTDKFGRTYGSSRTARVGVGGAYTPVGTDSPNPNAPKTTPEAGNPNPYQGGPTMSTAAPRASIAVNYESGTSNKSGYSGKDGRAGKYDGDMRNYKGPLEFVIVHRSTANPNWAQQFFLGDRMLFGPKAADRMSGPSKADLDTVLADGTADNVHTGQVPDAITVSTPADKLEWATKPLPQPNIMNPGIYLGKPPALPAEPITAGMFGEFANVEHVKITPNVTEGAYIALAKRIEPVVTGPRDADSQPNSDSQSNSDGPQTDTPVRRKPPKGSGTWSSWGQGTITTGENGTQFTYKHSDLTRPGSTTGNAVRSFIGKVGSHGTATQGFDGRPNSTGKMVREGRLTDFNGKLDGDAKYYAPRLVDIRPNSTLKRNQAGDQVAGSTKSWGLGADIEVSGAVVPKRTSGTGAMLSAVLGGGGKHGRSHALDVTSGGKQNFEYKGPTAFVAFDTRYKYSADMNLRNLFAKGSFDNVDVFVDQPDGVLVEMPVEHAIKLFGDNVPPELTAALPQPKTPVTDAAHTLVPNGDQYASYSDTSVIDSRLTDKNWSNSVESRLDGLGIKDKDWQQEIIGQIDTMLNTPAGYVWLKDALAGAQGHGGLLSVPNPNARFEDVADIRIVAKHSDRPTTGPANTGLVPDKFVTSDYVTVSKQDKKSTVWNVTGALNVGVRHAQTPSVPPGQPDANGKIQQSQPNAGASSGTFMPQIFGGSKSWKTDSFIDGDGTGSEKLTTQVDTDKVGRDTQAVTYELDITRRRTPMPGFDTFFLGAPKHANWDTTVPKADTQSTTPDNQTQQDQQNQPSQNQSNQNPPGQNQPSQNQPSQNQPGTTQPSDSQQNTPNNSQERKPVLINGEVDLVSPSGEVLPPLPKPAQQPTFEVVDGMPSERHLPFGPQDGWRFVAFGTDTVNAIHDMTYAQLSGTKLTGDLSQSVPNAAGVASEYTRPGSNSEYILHNAVKGTSLHNAGNTIFTDAYGVGRILGSKHPFYDALFDMKIMGDINKNDLTFHQAVPADTTMNLSQDKEKATPKGTTKTVTTGASIAVASSGANTVPGAGPAPTTTGVGPPAAETVSNDKVTATSSKTAETTGAKYSGRSYLFIPTTATIYSQVNTYGSNWTHKPINAMKDTVFGRSHPRSGTMKVTSHRDMMVQVWENTALDKGLLTLGDVWQHANKLPSTDATYGVTRNTNGATIHPPGNTNPTSGNPSQDAPPGRNLHVENGVTADQIRTFVGSLPKDMRPVTYTVANGQPLTIADITSTVADLPEPPAADTTPPPLPTIPETDENTESAPEPKGKAPESKTTEPQPEAKQTQPSDKQTQPSDKQTQPSDKQTQPSDKQAPPSDVQSQPSEVQTQPSDVRSESSGKRPESSDVQSQPSDALPESSGKRPESSDVQAPPRDVQSESSDVQVQPKDVQSQPSDVRSESSGKQPESSDVQSQPGGTQPGVSDTHSGNSENKSGDKQSQPTDKKTKSGQGGKPGQESTQPGPKDSQSESQSDSRGDKPEVNQGDLGPKAVPPAQEGNPAPTDSLGAPWQASGSSSNPAPSVPVEAGPAVAGPGKRSRDVFEAEDGPATAPEPRAMRPVPERVVPPASADMSQLAGVVQPGNKFVNPNLFVSYINGSRKDLGRDVNCVDAALSFHSTYHGIPRVAGSAPAGPPRGAGTSAAEELGYAPELVGWGPDGLAEVIDRVTRGGHGSDAVVFGFPQRGQGHAWNVVNHHGIVSIVDSQAGTTSLAHPDAVPGLARVYTVPLDANNNYIPHHVEREVNLSEFLHMDMVDMQPRATVTPQQANEFYHLLANATFNHPTSGELTIPTEHPEDGCYIRAHLWAQQLKAWRVDVRKVFIGRGGTGLVTSSANAFGGTADTPQTINWNYHVAPLISVDPGNGNPPELVVLDPAMGKGVVSVRDWFAMAGVTDGYDEADLSTVKPHPNEYQGNLADGEPRVLVTDEHAMAPPWLQGNFPVTFDQATDLVNTWLDLLRDYSIEATTRQEFRSWHDSLPSGARDSFNGLYQNLDVNGRRDFQEWFRSLGQDERTDLANKFGQETTSATDLVPNWADRVNVARTHLANLDADTRATRTSDALSIILMHHDATSDPTLWSEITDVVAHRYHTESMFHAINLSLRLATEHGTTLPPIDVSTLPQNWWTGLDLSAPAPANPADGSFDPNAFDPNAFDPSTFDPGTFDPGTFDPGTFDPDAFDLSTFDPSTFDPSTFDPNAFDPNLFDVNALAMPQPSGPQAVFDFFDFGLAAGPSNTQNNTNNDPSADTLGGRSRNDAPATNSLGAQNQNAAPPTDSLGGRNQQGGPSNPAAGPSNPAAGLSNPAVGPSNVAPGSSTQDVTMAEAGPSKRSRDTFESDGPATTLESRDARPTPERLVPPSRRDVDMLTAIVPPGTKFTDPNTFAAHINGSRKDLGRDVNCVDAGLAFHSTYHGNPRVAGSAPGGLPRSAGTSAGEELGYAAELVGHGANGFAEVINRVTRAGHGADALVFGFPQLGQGHTWNVVNHHGLVSIVDAQAGTVAPAYSQKLPALDRVYAIPLDADGNFVSHQHDREVDLSEFLNMDMVDLRPRTHSTFAQANDYYNLLATATFNHPASGTLTIPTEHPEDGCYIRAHLWAQQLREWGLDVRKVFIGREGPGLTTQSTNAFGATSDNPRPVNWRYHVAPLISVDLENGLPPVWAVLDPAMGLGVVPVSDWFAAAGVSDGYDQSDLYVVKPHPNSYQGPLAPGEARVMVTDEHAMAPPWLEGNFPATFDQATDLVNTWQDRTREYSLEATTRREFRDWHASLPDQGKNWFNFLDSILDSNGRRDFHDWFRSLGQHERANFANQLADPASTVFNLVPNWDDRVSAARIHLANLSDDARDTARNNAAAIIFGHHNLMSDPNLIDAITDVVAYRHHTEGVFRASDLSQRLATEHGTSLFPPAPAMPDPAAPVMPDLGAQTWWLDLGDVPVPAMPDQAMTFDPDAFFDFDAATVPQPGNQHGGPFTDALGGLPPTDSLGGFGKDTPSNLSDLPALRPKSRPHDLSQQDAATAKRDGTLWEHRDPHMPKSQAPRDAAEPVVVKSKAEVAQWFSAALGEYGLRPFLSGGGALGFQNGSRPIKDLDFRVTADDAGFTDFNEPAGQQLQHFLNAIKGKQLRDQYHKDRDAASSTVPKGGKVDAFNPVGKGRDASRTSGSLNVLGHEVSLSVVPGPAPQTRQLGADGTPNIAVLSLEELRADKLRTMISRTKREEESVKKVAQDLFDFLDSMDLLDREAGRTAPSSFRIPNTTAAHLDAAIRERIPAYRERNLDGGTLVHLSDDDVHALMKTRAVLTAQAHLRRGARSVAIDNLLHDSTHVGDDTRNGPARKARLDERLQALADVPITSENRSALKHWMRHWNDPTSFGPPRAGGSSRPQVRPGAPAGELPTPGSEVELVGQYPIEDLMEIQADQIDANVRNALNANNRSAEQIMRVLAFSDGFRSLPDSKVNSQTLDAFGMSKSEFGKGYPALKNAGLVTPSEAGLSLTEEGWRLVPPSGPSYVLDNHPLFPPDSSRSTSRSSSPGPEPVRRRPVTPEGFYDLGQDSRTVLDALPPARQQRLRVEAVEFLRDAGWRVPLPAHQYHQAVAIVGQTLEDDGPRMARDIATDLFTALTQPDSPTTDSLGGHAWTGAVVPQEVTVSSDSTADDAVVPESRPGKRSRDEFEADQGPVTTYEPPEVRPVPERLRPPAPADTAALLAAVPPGTRFTDPASFVQLINGTRAEVGRDVNCVDAALAFHATYHGNPRVAGIAANGLPRSAATAAAEELSYAPEMFSRGEKGVAEVLERVARAGHGADALLFGFPRKGQGHVWNIVNHRGIVSIVDAQSGTIVPATASALPGLDRVYAIPVDAAGNFITDNAPPPTLRPGADQYAAAEHARALEAHRIRAAAAAGEEIPVPGTGGRLVPSLGGLRLVGAAVTAELAAELAALSGRDVIALVIGPDAEEDERDDDPVGELLLLRFSPRGRPEPVEATPAQ